MEQQIPCTFCGGKTKLNKTKWKLVVGILVILTGVSWIGHLPIFPILPYILIVIGALYVWLTPLYKCLACKKFFNQKDVKK